MKTLVLGTSELTIRCAMALLDNGIELCALISMPKHALPNNSANVSGFAKKNSIPYQEIEDINAPSSLELLRGYDADYFLSSWPRILKSPALDVPNRFCIGTHPNALPHNRGRHPLHWLIVLGFAESSLSFFLMDQGIDTGNVLLQMPFELSSNDSIGDLQGKVDAAAYEGTKTLFSLLMREPSFWGIEQDHERANYWRKRTPHDVTLDPRMSADMVLRTVQSFAPPHPCANLVFENHILKVSHAWIDEKNSEMNRKQLQRMEHGKITAVDGQCVSMKVDDAIVTLECEGPIPPRLISTGYVHPPTKYLQQWPGTLSEPVSDPKKSSSDRVRFQGE